MKPNQNNIFSDLLFVSKEVLEKNQKMFKIKITGIDQRQLCDHTISSLSRLFLKDNKGIKQTYKSKDKRREESSRGGILIY